MFDFEEENIGKIIPMYICILVLHSVFEEGECNTNIHI